MKALIGREGIREKHEMLIFSVIESYLANTYRIEAGMTGAKSSARDMCYCFGMKEVGVDDGT